MDVIDERAYFIDESVELDLDALPKWMQNDIARWCEIIATGNCALMEGLSLGLVSSLRQAEEFGEIEQELIDKIWAKYLNNRR